MSESNCQGESGIGSSHRAPHSATEPHSTSVAARRIRSFAESLVTAGRIGDGPWARSLARELRLAPTRPGAFALGMGVGQAPAGQLPIKRRLTPCQLLRKMP